MRVVLTDFISLDGVIQAPGGAEEDTDGGFEHGGWSMARFDPDSMGTFIEAAMASATGLLFGRRTWQAMAAAWPDRAGDPYADRMNELPKYVASRTLSQEDMTWGNSTLLPPDDAVGAVGRLRDQEDGDVLVWGSATLARDLIAHDLVDEYQLMLYPLILGGGKRLFPDNGLARPLDLVATTLSSTGVQICTYRPARDS